MAHSYDVVVLGSGVAGGVAARKLQENGLKVAMVEPGLLGGTCPLRGCEPKKVLFDAVDAVLRSRHQSGQGLHGEPELDWQELVRFKNSFTEPIPGKIEKDLARRSIDLFKGTGRFVAPDTVEVDSELVQGSHVLICTGAGPRPLDFPGAEHVTPSYGFFDLERLPRRMTVIGGGYIAFEFAHMAVRAGVRVSLVVRSDWCLKAFDPDLVGKLVDDSRKLGIDIHFNAPMDRIDKRDQTLLVSAGNGSVQIEADLVLHGAGRIPNVQGLDCEKGQVEVSRKGIAVNEHLQSVSNPRVYASGDVIETGPQLTPVALKEAEIVAANVLEPGSARVDYTGMPSILFTHPVMARAGLLEKECRSEGIDYEVHWADASHWASYQRLGERLAGVKVLTSPDRDTVLGAHFLGRHAEEVVNIFALAIQQGVPLKDLTSVVWSYPSTGYDVMRHVLA